MNGMLSKLQLTDYQNIQNNPYAEKHMNVILDTLVPYFMNTAIIPSICCANQAFYWC